MGKPEVKGVDVMTALHISSQIRSNVNFQNTEKKSLSNAEKMKRWREEKIKKKQAADKKYDKQKCEHKIAEVKENRDRK